MRLPTREEFTAFESEELVRHQQHCGRHDSGGCEDSPALQSLCSIMNACNSQSLHVLLETCLVANRLSVLAIEEIKYAFAVGMLEGLKLGRKLVEQDALDKLCLGSDGTK